MAVSFINEGVTPWKYILVPVLYGGEEIQFFRRTRTLMSEAAEQRRYCSCHEKIKSVSLPSCNVIFIILYYILILFYSIIIRASGISILQVVKNLVNTLVYIVINPFMDECSTH